MAQENAPSGLNPAGRLMAIDQFLGGSAVVFISYQPLAVSYQLTDRALGLPALKDGGC